MTVCSPIASAAYGPVTEPTCGVAAVVEPERPSSVSLTVQPADGTEPLGTRRTG